MSAAQKLIWRQQTGLERLRPQINTAQGYPALLLMCVSSSERLSFQAKTNKTQEQTVRLERCDAVVP